MSKALLVSITGRVQGVGYRAWTVETAKARGVNGWVRNRRDGSVEALIAGDDAQVDQMVGYFWQGPVSARVERVVASPATDPMQIGFRTLPTA